MDDTHPTVAALGFDPRDTIDHEIDLVRVLTETGTEVFDVADNIGAIHFELKLAELDAPRITWGELFLLRAVTATCAGLRGFLRGIVFGRLGTLDLNNPEVQGWIAEQPVPVQEAITAALQSTHKGAPTVSLYTAASPQDPVDVVTLAPNDPGC